MAKEKRLSEEVSLEELRHKNRMEEIEKEFEFRKRAEATRFDNQMSMHRLKRADIRRTQTRKDFDYANQSH